MVTILLSYPHAASAGIDVSGLRVDDGATANTRNVVLAGVTYTPAAMILQMAEQTASMEGIMRQSALDGTDRRMTRGQRVAAGSNGEGPGVVARDDLVRSVEVMVANSRIAAFAPAAAVTLQGIPPLVRIGTGDLTPDEYVAVANKYEAAREDLRRAFDTLSPQEQEEGKTIVRRLRAGDEERMRQQRPQR